MYKFIVISCLALSANCMFLHQQQFQQIPLSYDQHLQQYDTPNYNFAYSVNDAHTGDIKDQHESRRGDTVLGQYSLLQPDGVRRTVDYRADEHAGFRATVNNDERRGNERQIVQQNGLQTGLQNGLSNGYQNVAQNGISNGYQNAAQNGQQNVAQSGHQNVAQNSLQNQPQNVQVQSRQNSQSPVEAPEQGYAWPSPATARPIPAVAVSRSSIVQTFTHNTNPWY